MAQADGSFTIHIVDDDEDIRTSLSRALGKRGYAVRTHEAAVAFLAAYDGTGEGCLILDYGMPGMNGLELQRLLNERGWSIPVIFITGHGGVPESVQAIKGGAIDFLEKPFRQADLVERIEVAAGIARTRRSHDARARHLSALLDRLTARETEIARRIADNPSETSSKEIAAWLGISPRTVDHHRARILEKLELRSITELVAFMRG